MSESFEVERVAIHLVDRSEPEPRFAPDEIDLAAFGPEDRAALDAFFDGHLWRAWRAEEGARTRAASLEAGSVVGEQLPGLAAGGPDWFERTRRLARHLWEVSHGLNTSRGLLMVLAFRRVGEDRRFLGLFKMDPGPADLVRLRRTPGGQLLLDLAVEHVEQTLPDARAGVLKWALLPHPTRPSFDVKLKDDEGPAELALYFQRFLGCRARKSPKEQLQVVVEEVRRYAAEEHPEENAQGALDDVIASLAGRERVTAEAVGEALEGSRLAGARPAALRQRLVARDAGDVDFPSAVLRSARVEFQLSNRIVVRGPLDAVEDYVQIVELGDEVELRIRTGSYEKRYV